MRVFLSTIGDKFGRNFGNWALQSAAQDEVLRIYRDSEPQFEALVRGRFDRWDEDDEEKEPWGHVTATRLPEDARAALRAGLALAIDACGQLEAEVECAGCAWSDFVRADQSFDAGEWSGSHDYGPEPDHTCLAYYSYMASPEVRAHQEYEREVGQ